jgi:catabolite regulation protein CreA
MHDIASRGGNLKGIVQLHSKCHICKSTSRVSNILSNYAEDRSSHSLTSRRVGYYKGAMARGSSTKAKPIVWMKSKTKMHESLEVVKFYPLLYRSRI